MVTIILWALILSVVNANINAVDDVKLLPLNFVFKYRYVYSDFEPEAHIMPPLANATVKMDLKVVAH